MLLLARGQEPRRITAHAREVFDVTGAGDTVLAAFGVAVGCGLGFFEAAEVANRAASYAVGRVGTAPVHWADLFEGAAASPHEKLLDRAHLPAVSSMLRRAHKSVVFTNGCFDLLHAGHVKLLTEARQSGDVLVVGLNSDASVRRLKGDGRPILSEADRAQVLGGLDAVDFVVVFDEDTPEAVIRELRPQTLVKGGDYTEATVVGAPFVRSYGGCRRPRPARRGPLDVLDGHAPEGRRLMRAYFGDLAALAAGAGPLDRARRGEGRAARRGRGALGAHDVRVRERRKRDAGAALRGRARRALPGRPARAPGGRAHGRHRDPDRLRERLRLLGRVLAPDRGARARRATWPWASRPRVRAPTC